MLCHWNVQLPQDLLCPHLLRPLRHIQSRNLRHLLLEHLALGHHCREGIVKPHQDVAQPRQVPLTTHPHRLCQLLLQPLAELVLVL